MFEFRIEVLNKKFEDTKEEVNNGKLLVYAKWEVEDLLEEAKELKSLIETEQGLQDINALINQLTQYINELEDFISKDCSTTL